MEEKNVSQIASILTVEQGKKLSLTAVESVDSFSESAITLTVNGKKVQIAGVGLKVQSFSQGSGNFTASGEVNSVKFGGKSLSKLFK